MALLSRAGPARGATDIEGAGLRAGALVQPNWLKSKFISGPGGAMKLPMM